MSMPSETPKLARSSGWRLVFHLFEDSPRDLGRRVEVAARCKDQELVAAEARADVAGAHASTNRFRDVDQQFVADHVAVVVVDAFEVVDVDQDRRVGRSAHREGFEMRSVRRGG